MGTSTDDAGGLFAGPGLMSSLYRSVDWGATPLGPPETWAPALRTAVRTALASPFPINLWCEPGMILVYNDAYAAVLGAKHPEALGRPGYEVWEEIWDEIEPMFERIREGGPPIYAEDAPFLVSRADPEGPPEGGGEPNAWFTFSLSPVREEDGRIVAFLNIVSETTRRILAERERQEARRQAERAEARLKEVFAQAPAFMAVLRGPSHVFEYVNQEYYNLVGERDLIGRPVLEALPEIRDQGFESLLDEVSETGEPYVGREQRVVLSRSAGGDLEERWVDFVYYPVTEVDGGVSGVVVHGSDVTEHVRSRMKAEQAREEAEEASRAKSRFLAAVSHELRTPINAIIGYAGLLGMEVDGPITEGQRAHLQRLEGSSRHLLMLIDDLLDLTRVEAGRIEVKREPFAVAPVVEEAVSLVSVQARDEEIELRDSCTGATELRGRGDPARVRQILVNVLSNAVKFTPAGGSVRIRCGRSGDAEPGEPDRPAAIPEPALFISVIDTGIGIEPGETERIFEPFAQAEGELSRTYGGAGLGLPISRRLARLMEGELTAESEPGRGSVFTLWLPLQA